MIWIGILLLMLSVLPATAATYYTALGGTAGSCGAAANTITNPFGNINSMLGCLGPGDTGYIRAGTYAVQLSSFAGTPWPTGTSWNPGGYITIAGFPGERPVIKPTSGDNVVGIYDNGGYTDTSYRQYLVIDNLTFDGSALPLAGQVVKPDIGARRIRFQNCTVIGNSGTNGIQLGGDNGANGTATSFAYEIEARNCEVYGNGGYGFYWGTHHNIIDGNYIHDNAGYGIHLYSADALDHVHDNVIRNNVLERNGSGACGPGGVPCGVIIMLHQNNLAYNNIIKNNGNNIIAAIIIRYGRGSAAYNNTIVNNGTLVACLSNEIPNGNPAGIFQNNICQGNTQNGVHDEGNIVQDHNDFSGNTFDSQLKLVAGSAGIDTGLNFTGTFSTDISGAGRPGIGGLWDKGAWEASASALIPSSGIFFMAQGGVNSADCNAAKGTVGAPSASPFGSYDIAKQCMTPPWTLYMRGGIYPALDTAVSTFVGGTSEATRGIFVGYPGEQVILRGGGQTSSGNPVVYMHGTDQYLTLKDMILESGGNGFAGVGAKNIVLDNVEVRQTYYEGVFLSVTQHMRVQGGSCHGTVVAGLGCIGLDGTSDTTVTGVEVYGSAGIGVSNNGYSGNSNLLLEKNTIRNNVQEGIAVGSGTGMKVQNNIVQQNSIGVHILAGEQGAQVQYNTIWGSVNSCMVLEGGVSATVVDNVCNQQASIINNAGASVTFTSNSCTGVAGCDTGNPLFTSTVPGQTGFLHLAVGSPARDSGVVVPGLAQDITGRARPTGTGVDKPDRGVYEEVYQAAGGGGAPPPAVIQPGRTSMFLIP